MIAEDQSDVNIMAVDSPEELSVGHKRHRTDMDVQENARVVSPMLSNRKNWRVVVSLMDTLARTAVSHRGIHVLADEVCCG